MGSEEKNRQKKLKRRNKKKGGGQGSEGAPQPQVITDDRFASAQSDPRFLEAPKRRSKVPIDSRFRHVFTHNSFTSSNASVDKRGKPNKNDKAAISLKHYYRLQQRDEHEKSPIEEDEDVESDSDVERDQIGLQTGSETETSIETLEDDDAKDDDDVHSLDGSSSTSTTDSDDEYIDEEEEDTFMQLVRILSLSCLFSLISFPFLPFPLCGMA